jgi:hypothetical protein
MSKEGSAMPEGSPAAPVGFVTAVEAAGVVVVPLVPPEAGAEDGVPPPHAARIKAIGIRRAPARPAVRMSVM